DVGHAVQLGTTLLLAHRNLPQRPAIGRGQGHHGAVIVADEHIAWTQYRTAVAAQRQGRDLVVPEPAALAVAHVKGGQPPVVATDEHHAEPDHRGRDD